MPRSFSVSSPKQFSLNRDRGEALFTVNSLQARPVRGRIAASPTGMMRASWLTVVGDMEHDFPPNHSESITVRVIIPPGTAAGRYGFRLDAINVADTDQDFAQSELVEFDIQPGQVPVKKMPLWILPTAVAILLVLGVIGWQMRQRPTLVDKPIPDVVNKPIAEAKQIIEAAGFVAVEKELQATDKEPGTVLDQVPHASDPPVKPGTTIELIVEAPLADVPNLVGQGVEGEAVKALLNERGLQLAVELTRLATDTSVGTILEQDPKFDAQRKIYIRRNIPILVVVAEEGVLVPKITGKSISEAAVLLSPDLTLGSPETANGPGVPGTILSQNPAAGKLVAKYSTVSITAKPQLVPAPLLTGKSYSDAVEVVAAVGLRITIIKNPASPKIDYPFMLRAFQPDKVVSQNIKPGDAPVPLGTEIEVTVTWKSNIQPLKNDGKVLSPAILKELKRMSPP